VLNRLHIETTPGWAQSGKDMREKKVKKKKKKKDRGAVLLGYNE
jgi:hypothetical protein